MSTQTGKKCGPLPTAGASPSTAPYWPKLTKARRHGSSHQRRLLLTDETGAVLVNAVVGTDQEPWVRIHDFDGRNLIISRGPIEPAMADESFFVIDFACDSCTTRFTASAASATLVATDTSWKGPVSFSELTLEGRSE